MTKKNKKSSVIAISLLSLCIVVSLVFITSQRPSMQRVSLMADWTDQQETFSQAYDNSKSVLMGKVKSIKSYEDRNVIFSMAEVETTKVFKGEVNNIINVLFTGGIVDNVEYICEDEMLPKLNENYLFILKERDNKNEYIPIGGYQGIFAIDKNDVKAFNLGQNSPIHIKTFNKGNNLEKELKEKNIIEELSKKSKANN